jgi:hypothetical protein
MFACGYTIARFQPKTRQRFLAKIVAPVLRKKHKDYVIVKASLDDAFMQILENLFPSAFREVNQLRGNQTILAYLEQGFLAEYRERYPGVVFRKDIALLNVYLILRSRMEPLRVAYQKNLMKFFAAQDHTSVQHESIQAGYHHKTPLNWQNLHQPNRTYAALQGAFLCLPSDAKHPLYYACQKVIDVARAQTEGNHYIHCPAGHLYDMHDGEHFYANFTHFIEGYIFSLISNCFIQLERNYSAKSTLFYYNNNEVMFVISYKRFAKEKRRLDELLQINCKRLGLRKPLFFTYEKIRPITTGDV